MRFAGPVRLLVCGLEGCHVTLRQPVAGWTRQAGHEVLTSIGTAPTTASN